MPCVVTEVVTETDISQCSVATATHLRCGEIFSESIITNSFDDSDSEKSYNIGQYLLKL